MNTYSSYNDEELLAFLQNGDKKAFKEIYERYWQKLFITAHFRLNNPQEAEELVQDVLFNLWRKKEGLRLTHTLATYLAAAVKYEVINRLDKQRRHNAFAANTDGLQIADDTTEQHLSFTELQSRLAKLVKQLPDKCRLVFNLSREEGLSQKEIAKQLKISENTVESHIKHALKALRTGLQQFLFTFF